MIYTVKITYQDGSTDIKECHDLSDFALDNIVELKVIREEDEITHCAVTNKPTSSSNNKECKAKKGKP